MDERMRFVGRLLSGEKMAPLCREFGISRVTGHKIWNRYRQDGARGIYNRSRAPHKHPNQLPFEIEQLIVRLKKEKPKWGAPKIRELVAKKYPGIKLPATSTVHLVLDRHGLVDRKKRRNKYRAVATYRRCVQKILRPYQGLPDVTYPGYDRSALISNCGRVCIGKRKIHIGKALSNQPVGLKEVDDGIWQVDFMSYTLGFFDEDSDRFALCEDPFGFRIDC